MHDSESFFQVELTAPKSRSSDIEKFFINSGALGHYEMLFDIDGPSQLLTENTRLFFFFDKGFPVHAFIPMALGALNLSECDYTVTETAYKDYIKVFEDTFTGFALTDKFWLHPPWEEAGHENTGCYILPLRPGLAFGTGRHPTTRLMIAFLEQVTPAATLLDMGCGSGILALAALVLGVEKVYGVDIEKLAVQSARDNEALLREHNPATGAAEFRQGDLNKFTDLEPDIFIANILPSVFYNNRDALKTHIENSRIWALSGIPEARLDEFKDWFRREISDCELDAAVLDDWSLLFRAGSADTALFNNLEVI